MSNTVGEVTKNEVAMVEIALHTYVYILYIIYIYTYVPTQLSHLDKQDKCLRLAQLSQQSHHNAIHFLL